jgi:hypothetical protein
MVQLMVHPKLSLNEVQTSNRVKMGLEFGQKDLYICTQGHVQENDSYSVTGHNDWSLTL